MWTKKYDLSYGYLEAYELELKMFIRHLRPLRNTNWNFRICRGNSVYVYTLYVIRVYTYGRFQQVCNPCKLPTYVSL